DEDLPEELKVKFDALFKENQKIVQPFFNRYPELKEAYENYITDTDSGIAEKQQNLIATILPEMINLRKRQLILQTVSSAVSCEYNFVQTFLDSSIDTLHAVDEKDKTALSDL